MYVNDSDYMNNYWYPKSKKSDQFTLLLLERDDFQSDVRSFRKKWGIPTEGFVDDAEHVAWNKRFGDTKYPDEKFIQDLSDVFIRSEKYELGAVSWHPLSQYILKNEVKGSFSGVTPRVVTRGDRWTSEIIYSMEFYPHTTEAEVRKTFNLFKAANFQDKRKQLIPETKLNKMKRAYELRKQGLLWKDVALTVNKELGGSLEYNDANKLVQQYKKHLGI